MASLRRGLAILIASLLALLALVPVAHGAELRWRPCAGVLCARLAVPLDRSGVVPGGVSLLVQRRPARRGLRRDVVVVLAGRPGMAAIQPFSRMFRDQRPLDDWARLSPHSDIVTFDPRGTGRSGRLRCRGLERDRVRDPGSAVAACAAELGERRAHYTTSDTIDDLEALRVALGSPRLTLIGRSYGTYVAQRYAIRYPHAVEQMVLDSVVDPLGLEPIDRDRFAATRRVLARHCRRGCGFTRDVVADVAKLSRRLAKRPMRGAVGVAGGGRRVVSLTNAGLLAAFDPSDSGAGLSFGTEFPGAVVSALRGDPTPILRLRERKRASLGFGSGFSFGSAIGFSPAAEAATLCEEVAFPYPRTTAPAQRPGLAQAAARALGNAAFAPFDLSTAVDDPLLRLCREWPTSPVAKPLEPPVLPDVRTLILAGWLDTVTPVETARRVAARLPRATLIESPDASHSVHHQGADGSCADYAVEEFLAGRDPRWRCRGEQPRALRVMRMAPTSLAALEPVPGVPGDRGRVLAAVALTIEDTFVDSYPALLTWALQGSKRPTLWAPGLRGGRLRTALRGGDIHSRLERLEWLPGLRVSGVLRREDAKSSGWLRVEGGAGPGGYMRVEGEGFRGRLGGRPFHLRSFELGNGALLARPSAAGLVSGG